MAGWRQWGIGEVVEAEDFQSFVQDQVVQVFTNATARNAALGTAVAQGMVAYLQDISQLQVYGTAWAAVSNPGDITGVAAGTALTGGGTTGDVTLNVNLAAVGSAVTIAASQVNGLTATASELNILDGAILDTSELNFLDGVTSSVQTQIDGRVSQTNGVVTTAAVGSAVVRNVSLATAAPGTATGMDGDVWLVYTP